MLTGLGLKREDVDPIILDGRIKEYAEPRLKSLCPRENRSKLPRRGWTPLIEPCWRM
jgi:hypothetical protein